MTRHPIPTGSILGGFEPLGFVAGERRWRSPDGRRLYTWDAYHGEVEAFDRRGNHLGGLDPMTGTKRKAAIPGRTLKV